MAPKPAAPPMPAADPPTSSEEEDRDMSSSEEEEEVVDEKPVSEEESAEEWDEEEEVVEEANLQPPRKKSVDSPVPAAPEEDEEDADLQPAEVEQPAAKSPARKRKRASGEKRLDDLSKDVWGDLPAGTEPQGKCFDQMCELYPHLAREMQLIAQLHPALKSSFNRLDDETARSFDEKLEKVGWKDLKIQMQIATKVDVPKARIRKTLVDMLAEVSKNV